MDQPCPKVPLTVRDLFDKKVHHRARSSMDSRSIGLGSLRLAILSHTPRHFAKKTRPVVWDQKKFTCVKLMPFDPCSKLNEFYCGCKNLGPLSAAICLVSVPLGTKASPPNQHRKPSVPKCDKVSRCPCSAKARAIPRSHHCAKTCISRLDRRVENPIRG